MVEPVTRLAIWYYSNSIVYVSDWNITTLFLVICTSFTMISKLIWVGRVFRNRTIMQHENRQPYENSLALEGNFWAFDWLPWLRFTMTMTMYGQPQWKGEAQQINDMRWISIELNLHISFSTCQHSTNASNCHCFTLGWDFARKSPRQLSLATLTGCFHG